MNTSRSRAKFKCPQCNGLKDRPGRCNLCGKLPMDRELLTGEAVEHLKGFAKRRKLK